MPDTRTRRFALLSVAAAVATITLKSAAWWLTGSIGMLSDALESTVNLAGAMMMLSMLLVAARPPSGEFAYGYSKAEYFASGFEGTLILLAAAIITIAAIERLLTPRPLDYVGAGVAVSAIASLTNYAVAYKLLDAGRRYKSIALEADARHLMTDIWTSAGVIVGIGAVALTGWQRLDPLIALAVAANIIWTGIKLVQRSTFGLLDRALPAAEREILDRVLNHYRSQSIGFHAVRTRGAGARSFVSMHVLVPDQWSIARGHGLLEKIEEDIRAALPGTTVFTHLEPQGRPESYRDMDLDR